MCWQRKRLWLLSKLDYVINIEEGNDVDFEFCLKHLGSWPAFCLRKSCTLFRLANVVIIDCLLDAFINPVTILTNSPTTTVGINVQMIRKAMLLEVISNPCHFII
jgi:hypothetical protein